MKRIALLMIVTLANVSFSQVEYSQVYDKVMVRDMKSFQDHFLLRLDNLMYKELDEFILNCDKTYCKGGLAFMNASLEYEWIHVPESGRISDFWEDENFIYLLNPHRNNSKVSSSAKLFLLKLDKKGSLISKDLIDEVEFDRPNGSFDARFDVNGSIWKITNVPRGFKADYSRSRPGKPGKSYVIETLSLDLESRSTYYFEGKYLSFEAFDSKSDQVSLVFSADSTTINNALILGDSDELNRPSILLVRLTSAGELTNSTYIGTGSCSVGDIEYQGDNLIVAGSFSGNDSISDLPDCYFQGIRLRSPRSYFDEKLARNSFVTSLDQNLTVNWLNKISGTCSVYLKELSTSSDDIAISFNFKDSIRVADQQIYSLKETSKYQCADPIICFFNSEGDLSSYEQLDCYSSSWNKVFLFPDFTAIHGTFLYNMEVFGRKLKSKSKNSVYYLTIIENDER